MIWLVARLALADLRHDRLMVFCAGLTLAAVLVPVLLLLGLKTGLIERMMGELERDVTAVELRLRGNVALGAEWFEAIRRRPDVAFVAPRVRTFNRDVRYARADDPLRAREADFEASGAGDPLLGRLGQQVADGQVVVSARVAQEAGIGPGDVIQLWRSGARGQVARRFEATVMAVAPPGATSGRLIFGDWALGGRIEDTVERQDGRLADGTRSFASFRLYARDVRSVAGLARHLDQQGLEVDSDAARIEAVLELDRNLGTLFTALVGFMAVGTMGVLVATLWGNVARKRRSLALLRLIGCPARRLALFPVIQAGLIALLGSAVAAILAWAGAALINQLWGARLGMPQLCRIHVADAALVTGAALLISLASAVSALRPVMRIEPAQGLREGS